MRADRHEAHRVVDTRVHRGGCPRKQGWEEAPGVTVN
jgi:hypothetical protein